MKLWMDKMCLFMGQEKIGMRKVDKVKQNRQIEVK